MRTGRGEGRAKGDEREGNEEEEKEGSGKTGEG